MKYTNMILVLIIHYFQQVSTGIEPKADKPVIAPITFFNRAIVIGIRESLAYIHLGYFMLKSRFSEYNIHKFIVSKIIYHSHPHGYLTSNVGNMTIPYL